MRVLIIEDDINKLGQLSEFVRNHLRDAEITERRAYQSGLKEAVHSQPDLILLDMSLPTYEIGGSEKGGRTRLFAGKEILGQLKRRGVQSKVIVVTQFERFGEGASIVTLDELRRDMELDFADNYIGTVFYQPAQSGWRADLDEVLTCLLGGKA